MTSDPKRIVEFVHDADVRLTNPERIALYRSFAKTTAVADLAAHFHLCADKLDAAEAACRQLVITFPDLNA